VAHHVLKRLAGQAPTRGCGERLTRGGVTTGCELLDQPARLATLQA
jgi:hypothetical protein